MNKEPTSSGLSCQDCADKTVSPTGQACVCDRGYYNSDASVSNPVCVVCRTGMDCSLSGSTIPTLALQPDYWRTNVNSTDIRACLTSGACLWSYNSTSGEAEPCASYRIGPLCQVDALGVT